MRAAPHTHTESRDSFVESPDAERELEVSVRVAAYRTAQPPREIPVPEVLCRGCCHGEHLGRCRECGHYCAAWQLHRLVPSRRAVRYAFGALALLGVVASLMLIVRGDVIGGTLYLLRSLCFCGAAYYVDRERGRYW